MAAQVLEKRDLTKITLKWEYTSANIKIAPHNLEASHAPCALTPHLLSHHLSPLPHLVHSIPQDFKSLSSQKIVRNRTTRFCIPYHQVRIPSPSMTLSVNDCYQHQPSARVTMWLPPLQALASPNDHYPASLNHRC